MILCSSDRNKGVQALDFSLQDDKMLKMVGVTMVYPILAVKFFKAVLLSMI
jgi:hypothetical protein